MKLSTLAYITPSQISALAVAIAKTKVPGLKTNAKKLLTAFAQIEGVSEEALAPKIDKLHNSAYQFSNQEAEFMELENGDVNLIKISADISVSGFSERTITMHNAIMDFDRVHMSSNLIPRCNHNDGDTQVPVNTRLRNLQLANNAAYEHCMFINDNVASITPEQLRALGYSVIIRQLKKENPAEESTSFPEYEKQYGNYIISMRHIGEGEMEDYDPTDPDDRPLMHYDIIEIIDGDSHPVDNTSYCTQLDAKTPSFQIFQAMDYIAAKALPLIPNNAHKRTCEELSHIGLRGGIQLVGMNGQPIIPEMEIEEPQKICVYCPTPIDSGEICPSCADKYKTDVFDIEPGMERRRRD